MTLRHGARVRRTFGQDLRQTISLAKARNKAYPPAFG